MPRNDFMYCFMQEAAEGGKKHMLYVYDAVRKYGELNWQTWQYNDSETSAKAFRDALDGIPDGEEIELHVNSIGGEVSEGVAIFNLLKQKREKGCKLVAYVDGAAYSIAMDIVMAAEEIHMGLGTTMFLHNPWMRCEGNAEQLRRYAEQLDALAAASRQLYLSRSAGKIEEAELKELMGKETMMDPETCMKYGFCEYIDTFKAKEPEEDKDQVIQELRDRLFRQEQINRTMKLAGMAPMAEGPEKAGKEHAEKVRRTMLAALRGA